MEIFAIIQIECRSRPNPSLSLSQSPILPQASPTSVSVKLLTPCQQWRRAYLDPVDGWVLVDLSHANIFSESAERVSAVCACVLTLPPTCTPQHVRRRLSPPPQALAACRFCPRHPVTPTVPSLEPDGWSSDPIATG